MIKVVDTSILNSRRNGVEFNNVLSAFAIKRCIMKDNKYSGIYIN